MTQPSTDVSQRPRDWRNGDAQVFDCLLPLVYDELCCLVPGYLRREHPGHTLQTTALVHEAYPALINHRHLARLRQTRMECGDSLALQTTETRVIQ